ncbi:uncharacterized protein LY89DRAFT_539687, partial [Mollisia scopiformis]
HPRRLPAHLSVSLRHESPPARSDEGHPGVRVTEKSGASPNRQDSDESRKSGESNVQKWFNNSNSRPETGYTHVADEAITADDPPYFVPHTSSSTSNNDVPISGVPRRYLLHGGRAMTQASSADDFRSVIDDLTIENKKLKERLRRYERSQPPQLEKDKMFELKIHGLPPRRRRELEDVLRQFASSIDESADEDAKPARNRRYPPFASLKPQTSSSTTNPKHTPSSSTSNSRPNDSAYASMSISGPTSTSTLNLVPEKKGSQPRVAREQNIQSFLHNIPEGLLPKHSPVMTERQKKKIVVQRLEQLFTGKRGAKAGQNSQPLQQQEVSNSAARADQAARIGPLEEEGSREAHILGMEIDFEPGKPSKLLADSSSGSRILTDSSDEQSPERSSPKQRPTRPLDLDPDRAQIPSENVEYIRHLGLSTPRLITENSADVAVDAEGWIYLNLLVNMAQLHIINVTPEFVRSAVSDVSEKFQISPDGKKVRWRGGSDGTRMSSDSGESSVRNRSPQESIDGHSCRKRRKVEVGKFASAPIEVDEPCMPLESSDPSSSFHYKPLFRHQNSSSGGMISTDESDSSFGSGPEMDGALKRGRGAHAWSGVSHSIGSKRRRRDDGPMVFYNGAKFCTDLSGDRGNILTPLHVFGIGKDGYSNQAQAALGSTVQKSTPGFTRTTSGSMLPYRPFKDYSKGNDPFQTEENRPKTPELFDDESEDEQFVLKNPPGSSSNALQEFEASGLGGVQPSDHFAVHVQTRRGKLDEASHPKLSRFSRLSSPGKAPRKFLHGISKKSIESFQEASPEEAITDRLAMWPGFSSPPRKTDVAADVDVVQTEILSAKYVQLPPSQLPPPVGWVATMDSQDEDDDDTDSSNASSSSAGISHLRRDMTFLHEPHGSYGQGINDMNDPDLADDSDGAEGTSETDSDIDMLAQVRQVDPYVVAEQERAFAMQVDD